MPLKTEILTSAYTAAHNSAPAGFGVWHFAPRLYMKPGDMHYFAFMAVDYSVAKSKASDLAAANGISLLWLIP